MPLKMTRKRYKSDLTDQEWLVLKPLIPAAKPGGHPRTANMREVVNGIFYVLRTGCPRDMMPKDLPPYSTVYYYFRRWQRTGVWEKINTQLRYQVRTGFGKATKPTVASADSQSVKTTEKRDGWCLEVTSRQGSHPAGKSTALMGVSR